MRWEDTNVKRLGKRGQRELENNWVNWTQQESVSGLWSVCLSAAIVLAWWQVRKIHTQMDKQILWRQGSCRVSGICLSPQFLVYELYSPVLHLQKLIYKILIISTKLRKNLNRTFQQLKKKKKDSIAPTVKIKENLHNWCNTSNNYCNTVIPTHSNFNINSVSLQWV